MGFLSRLSDRARPPASAAPLLMPKGIVARFPGPVYREEAQAEEEEQIAPRRVMRARAVRRQEAPAPEDGEGEMSRAPATGATEEQPEDEKMQPLRRAEAAQPEEEEEVQAVRRVDTSPAAEGEGEEIQAAPFVRRAEEVPLDDTERPLRQPTQSDLEPGATPPHPDLANEEEPSDLQALRRDVVPQASAPGRSGQPGHALGVWDPPEPATSYQADFAGWPDRAGSAFEPHDGADFQPRGTAGASGERPQVIIDQLDVLIHEPAPPRAAQRPATDHGRMLRARYLRRL